MKIEPGARVGPYEIVASIGAGGMGEVWRARDPRIGRDVAIKFVAAALQSPDRLHRFEQEARTAGSLNHPNLVTVFDLGNDTSAPYVVMELLEGETLRAKLDGGRIPIRKSVEYAAQIASGLAAAHDHGIVHRDLKPENIIVTPDGRVKIVDFGLAKLSARSEASDIVTQQRDTIPGTVLGTAGYMSPEQVKGQQVDHRSDIFSFGAILYEMLTGRRAFKRDSSVETMNAILKDDPPELASADAQIPPVLGSVVAHCLEKNPNERFQSARDLAFDLQRSSTVSHSGAGVALQPARPLMPLAIAAIVIIAVLAAWFAFRRTAPATASAPRESRTFRQLTYQSHENQPTLAPDGKTFAFASNLAGEQDIYVQRVDGRNAINLTKDAGADNYEPAFSPDGSQIAFRSDRDGGGIFVMGATGESVRRVSDFGFNPSWSPDASQLVVGTDSIVGNPRGRGSRSTLWVIDVRSSGKRQLTKSDGVQPAWSPHGNRIAFWGLIGEGGQRDIFTIDPHAADPEKTITRVTSDPQLDWSPAWSPDGKSLYFSSDRDGTLNLWRVAIDEASGKTLGALEPVTVPARYAGYFTMSRDGDMVFAATEVTETLWRVPMKDASQARAVFSGALQFYSAEFSPDGKWIAFSNQGPQEDIYLMRSDGTDVRQLTNDVEHDRAPSFSNDGRLIYFYAQRGSRYEMWSIKPDGSDLRQVSRLTGESLWYPRPTPDGKALLAFNGKTSAFLPFNEDGTITHIDPLPPVEQGVSLRWPRPSADGKSIVGQVLRPAAKEGIWLYTIATRTYERLTNHGAEPSWLPNGTPTAMFIDTGRAFTVDVKTKQEKPYIVPAIHNFGRFSVSADGQYLLVEERVDNSAVWLMKH